MSPFEYGVEEITKWSAARAGDVCDLLARLRELPTLMSVSEQATLLAVLSQAIVHVDVIKTRHQLAVLAYRLGLPVGDAAWEARSTCAEVRAALRRAGIDARSWKEQVAIRVAVDRHTVKRMTGAGVPCVDLRSPRERVYDAAWAWQRDVARVVADRYWGRPS